MDCLLWRGLWRRVPDRFSGAVVLWVGGCDCLRASVAEARLPLTTDLQCVWLLFALQIYLLWMLPPRPTEALACKHEMSVCACLATSLSQGSGLPATVLSAWKRLTSRRPAQTTLAGFVCPHTAVLDRDRLAFSSNASLSAPSIARQVVFSSQIGADVEFVDVVLHPFCLRPFESKTTVLC